MGTKVSKTAIGAFVLGAIALLVIAVLFLGAGKFLTKEHTYITYFEGSVKGLAEGSPVMFRGVKVGAVSSISLVADPRTRKLKIPVVFTLEPAKVKGTKAEFQRDPKFIETAVTQLGLRTQLQSVSFVTGQLMVGLDFFPDKQANFVRLNEAYPEIPSVPTPLEELQKTFETLPLKQIFANLNDTLDKVNNLVGSIDVEKSTAAIESTLHDAQALVRNVNKQVEPLASSLKKTSGAAEATLTETKETMAEARGHLNELATSTKSTLQSAEAALQQSQKTLKSFSGDSRLQAELNKSLRELSSASKSLRHLSDYLERHPESLLRGKEETKGE